jgi:acetyl esterase/lipase
MGELPKPPYDAELGAALAQMPNVPMTREIIPLMRKSIESMASVNHIISGGNISHEEITIPGPRGGILLSVFRLGNQTESGTKKPGIYFIHGGGMVAGNRFLGMDAVAEWIEECDAVCISVEYRLAPENPDPAPLEDCYAGVKWVGNNLETLGIDPEKLMIAGQSAGGGLAAGVALLVRDKGGPKLCAQCLCYPMLDDRNTTISSHQYATDGSWNRQKNLTGWSCLLGERAGGSEVDFYTAPGRATDLSELPPTFIDVTSAEVFRDENVAYATLLWASGVQAELHVWPGGFHGSDMLIPTAVLSKVARATRKAWVSRTFSAK